MNQTRIKVGTFTGAAAALSLNLGFIPDYFKWFMGEAIAAAGIAQGEYVKGMAAATAKISVAIVDNGTATTIDEQFAAANGITELDTITQVPEGWKASTVTALGKVVRPTLNNGYYYVCTTAGTTHSAEPAAWGTTVGGTTSEGGGTVVWTCYKQGDIPVERTKVQGVTIGTACMTNAKVYRYIAMRGM